MTNKFVLVTVAKELLQFNDGVPSTIRSFGREADLNE